MLVNKLNAMRNESDSENGFTLIELMIVVVIIGILAAIAIPIFANQQKEAIKAGVKSDVKNTVTNISTALVSAPTAGTVTSTGLVITAGTATAAVVQSSDNSIVVTSGATQGWSNYVVTGTNTAVTGFSYTFSASTGKYVQVG